MDRVVPVLAIVALVVGWNFCDVQAVRRARAEAPVERIQRHRRGAVIRRCRADRLHARPPRPVCRTHVVGRSRDLVGGGDRVVGRRCRGVLLASRRRRQQSSAV